MKNEVEAIYCPSEVHKHVPIKNGEKEVKKLLCAISVDRESIYVQCNDRKCKKHAGDANWYKVTMGDVPVVTKVSGRLDLHERIFIAAEE